MLRLFGFAELVFRTTEYSWLMTHVPVSYGEAPLVSCIHSIRSAQMGIEVPG